MQGQPVSFGPFSYDATTETLWREGRPVPLGTRASAVLLALIKANGDIVTRDALIDAAWGGAAVEENNLAVQIGTLRKTLGSRDDGEEWIATIPRVGYRLAREIPTLSDGRPSLAVLPFLNLSGDPDQEHIADGMVEDLTTAFSRFRTLGVVARQSAFAYKGRQFDIRDAARALKVRYLLEGSIRRFGDRVRVTAQLIDGSTGEHIWAENLDGPLGDIFEFQDRITSGVVGLIEPEIRKAELGRALRKHPGSLDANDLYWRGLALLQTANRHSHDGAVALLDRAVALEPTYAPILATAAYAHLKRDTDGEDLAVARSLCERALAADSGDPFVLLVAGMMELSGGDSAKALALAQRAYDLNPNSLLICNVVGYMHLADGNYEQTVALSQRALTLSPGSPERFWAMIGIARGHLAAGRFDDAVLWSLRALDANADQEEVRPVLIAAYALLGQTHDAESAHAALLNLNPDATLPHLIETFAGRANDNLRHGLGQLQAATTPRPARTRAAVAAG